MKLLEELDYSLGDLRLIEHCSKRSAPKRIKAITPLIRFVGDLLGIVPHNKMYNRYRTNPKPTASQMHDELTTRDCRNQPIA